MSNNQTVNTVYKKLIQIIQNDPLKHKNMIVETIGNRMNIKFNRPKRYNAFSMDMYFTFVNAVKTAQKNDAIKFIVISGQGGNFSSGNDLTNFSNSTLFQLGQMSDVIIANSMILRQFTQALINSKKPIIALVEGKCIGFVFTLLPLIDKVFALQTSQFIAPLVSSAQGPQLCASYTFPKIFGKTVAEQLVTFGKTVNADFLQKYNLLQKCKTKQEAQQRINNYLRQIDQLEWNSYINARRLYNERQAKILLQVCQRQLQNLFNRWSNPELLTHIAKHMERMKKRAKL